MKTAVIYYSLEGNTDYSAKLVAEKLGADLIKVETEKKYPSGNMKFMSGGREAVFGLKPRLKGYSFNASKYDTVIIGTPVWAKTLAGPTNTILNENDFSGKTIGYIISSASGKIDKAVEALDEKLERKPKAILSLVDPISTTNKFRTENAEALIDEFCHNMTA